MPKAGCSSYSVSSTSGHILKINWTHPALQKALSGCWGRAGSPGEILSLVLCTCRLYELSKHKNNTARSKEPLQQSWPVQHHSFALPESCLDVLCYCSTSWVCTAERSWLCFHVLAPFKTLSCPAGHGHTTSRGYLESRWNQPSNSSAQCWLSELNSFCIALKSLGYLRWFCRTRIGSMYTASFLSKLHRHQHLEANQDENWKWEHLQDSMNLQETSVFSLKTEEVLIKTATAVYTGKWRLTWSPVRAEG